jgi:nucleotidyltransferase-like protein
VDADVSLGERERGDSTSFDDLNQLLVELVLGAKEVLADSFCGAYLQGSFAVGDADAHSDVDFIIVTKKSSRRGRKLSFRHSTRRSTHKPHRGHSTSKARTSPRRFSGDPIPCAAHSSISTTAQPSSRSTTMTTPL